MLNGQKRYDSGKPQQENCLADCNDDILIIANFTKYDSRYIYQKLYRFR